MSKEKMMQDQTVVITGASDGVGAATARALHVLGARLVIVGRSPEKTKVIADELQSDYFVADFSRFADVRELAATLLKKRLIDSRARIIKYLQ